MTVEIHVERSIRAPARAIFAALADRARRGRSPSIGAARVPRPGLGDPRGLGEVTP